jgi:glycerophosphoryl diester phosphodiesterase
VRRTTNGRGRVSGLSREELASLDAGKGEHIPTLSEVIELVNKKVPINIELKSDDSGMAVALLLSQYIAKGWSPEHFIVSSFMYRELRIFVSRMPLVRVGILGEVVRKKMLSVADALHAYSLHLHYPHVSREVVENLHARGYQVFVWTVDNPEDITRMKQMGVDGIYSNLPDRI